MIKTERLKIDKIKFLIYLRRLIPKRRPNFLNR